MGRRTRECRRGAETVPAACEARCARHDRPLRERHGKSGRLIPRDGRGTRVASPASAQPAAAAKEVVAVRDVHYSIGGREIFTGLDLIVRRGRITAIMGPSGGGKTTLLKLITGQITADRGSVL